MGKPVVHWEFWTEDPNMGAFSLFSDPDGRVLGIWKQTAAR